MSQTSRKVFSCSNFLLPHKCRSCSFTTYEKIHLLTHICGQEPSAGSFFTASNYCLVISEDTQNLAEKRFECDQCSFKTNRRDVLRNHKVNKHLPYEQRKWFYCDQCPSKYFNKQNLERHILSHHTANELLQWYNCDKCAYKSIHRKYLMRHFRLRHSRAKKVLIEKKIECPHCLFQTKTKYSLNSHILNKHTPENLINWFTCEICPYRTKKLRILKEHMLIRHFHGDKKHKCDECSYTVNDSSSLRFHKLSKHVNDISNYFRCTMCDYKAIKSSNFRRHVRIKHSTRVKDFKCTECEFETYTKSYLKVHLLTKHSNDEERYKCDECSYATHLSERIKQHKINRHFPEELVRFHHCPHCDYKAKQRSTLKTHIKAKHVREDKEYKCTYYVSI